MGKLLLPPYVMYKSFYPEMESTKRWYICNNTTRHYTSKDCNIDSYFQLHGGCILSRLYRSSYTPDWGMMSIFATHYFGTWRSLILLYLNNPMFTCRLILLCNGIK